LLQVFVGYTDEGTVVSPLLTKAGLVTRRGRLSPSLLSRLLPVSVGSVMRLRQRDWAELAENLLPNELNRADAGLHRVVVAPSERVAAVPFAALPTARGPLGAVCELSTVPSFGLWEQLHQRAPSFARVVFVGIDATDHPEFGVVGVCEELATLADLGCAVSRVGSVGELSQGLDGADALVLAVHGDVLEGRNVLVFPDGSRLSALDLADLALPELVIGAACWSGALHGDPSPFSLVPACLLGGAREVVVTLWDADSLVLSETLRLVYAELAAGATSSQALHHARRRLGHLTSSTDALIAIAR
jgi:hypothetical protein